MAALIALSERKRVSYDLLQGLSTVDILYAENRFHGYPFSCTSRSRETLLHNNKKINGEQAIKWFKGEHLRIRSHESSSKRAGL